MKVLVPSTRCRKDLNRVRRRGYDLAKLDVILVKLQTDEPLPASKRAHPLKGAWSGYWDCHVEPRPDGPRIEAIPQGNGGPRSTLGRPGLHGGKPRRR